jgi:S-adenosylmethionine:tRNA ribosyltransferase-isomerase
MLAETCDLKTLSAYQFALPQELIANAPLAKRDQSRLMILNRQKGSIEEICFSDLASFLGKDTPLVVNDTKVIPARLIGKRDTSGQAEVLLLKRLSENTWEALVRPSKKLIPGSTVSFSDTFSCKVLDHLEDGKRLVAFSFQGDFYEELDRFGVMPLPPYIKRAPSKEDLTRYQTVFAKNEGAVAAPTAALHFTDELLAQFETISLTLHVGLGTFRPVQVEDISKHHMHKESYEISQEAAKRLNEVSPLCVGTTSLRALESAALSDGTIQPGSCDTDIFITPGYEFKYVNSLLTNFHLPGSTLLMLVSAFAGYELTMEAYNKAVADKYRFFSYGDAMLIL